MVWGPLLSAGIGAVGSLLGGRAAEKGKEKEIQYQREFAQHGIRWRVEDAKQAGIHPLYALGAQTTAYSPVGVGEGMGNAFHNAGQHLARAIESKSTADERAYNTKLMSLTLQRGELENQLLASQIARVNSPAQMPPPMPTVAQSGSVIDGQGDGLQPLPERFGGPLVENVPLERIKHAPGAPHSEPAAVTDVGWARTSSGGYAPVPSADFAERGQDSIIPQIGWAMRNMLGPNVSASFNRPPFEAPAGKHWVWSVMDQAYYLQSNR